MTTPHPKPIRLAWAALQAAQGGKRERARDLVVRISDECGGTGLCAALMTWIDTYADHATDGHADTMRPGRMKAIRSDTGEMHDPRTATEEELPDKVVWASALIEARSWLDEEWFKTLIAELPDDAAERGAYILQVLDSVALTINGLPRGFGRMRWPT